MHMFAPKGGDDGSLWALVEVVWMGPLFLCKAVRPQQTDCLVSDAFEGAGLGPSFTRSLAPPKLCTRVGTHFLLLDLQQQPSQETALVLEMTHEYCVPQEESG